MFSRVPRVSIAVLALLTAASACFAQDLPVTPAPVSVDTAAATPAAAAPKKSLVKGMASMGASLGVSAFIADGDYSNRRTDDLSDFGNTDIRERFAFGAAFRYGLTPWLRWQLSPGYSWTGYKKDSPIPFTDPNFPDDTTKEKVLTQVLPVSAQLQYVLERGRWKWHLGAGPGVYRVWVQNRRKVLKDPATKKLHRGFYPGASGEIGTARMLQTLPNTSIEFALGSHWVFATREEQFPSGFNSSLAYVDLRVGLNYHFDPKVRFKKPAPAGGAAVPAPR